MNEKKTLRILDDSGIEQEYEILLAFKWTKTNKNYVVYTNNTNDEEGNLNIFASIYYPYDDSKLDTLVTDEEWNEVEKRLRDLTD